MTELLRIACFATPCGNRLDVKIDQYAPGHKDAMKKLGWQVIDTDEYRDQRWKGRFGEQRIHLCADHAGVDPELIAKPVRFRRDW